jgi:hypothetical protein
VWKRDEKWAEKLGDFMGKWDDSGILVGRLWDFSGISWENDGKIMGF